MGLHKQKNIKNVIDIRGSGDIHLKRTLLTIGTVTVVTLSGVFFTESVHAQPSLEDVSTKQQQVKSKLSKAESDIADVLYEVKELNEEINRLETALDQNKKEISKTEEEIGTLQKDIDELNEKIEVRNDKLKERLSSYQENGGNIQFIEVLFGAKDAFEFISRVDAVTTITNADLDLIEDNENDRAEVEEKVEEQEFQIAELEEQEKTIKTQKEQVETNKKTLKAKEDKINKEKAKLQSESSDLAALEAEIRASFVAPEPTASENTSNSSSSSSSSNNSTNVSNNTSSNGTSNNSNTNTSTSKKSNTTKKVAYTGGGGSAIAAGRQFVGKSTYSYGSKNPSAGLFDCSGFVQWAYEQEGVSLPRTARGMGSVGTKVSLSQAQPGDLVLFRGGSHVGIYLGGGKFLGSQNSTGVAVANMSSGYWKDNFDGNVRRIK